MFRWTNSKQTYSAGLLAGLLACQSAASLKAQTFERDVTVTGPRGRTLERQTEIQRGPGGVERDLRITRPSGTYSRQVDIRRAPGPGFAPRGSWFGPRFAPWGPPPPGPSAGAMFGLGLGLAALPAIGFAAGAASRPPVVVAPAPVVVSPGVVAGGVPAQPALANPIDPVNLAAQKLYSNHYTSRRDGAIELGRLGDPRAVPALIHVLKYDTYKEVKIAAAGALGHIGGPEAATALERCITYEKKQAVKDAASSALTHLRAQEARLAESVSSNVRPNISRAPRPPEPHQPASPENSQDWIPNSSGRANRSPEPLPTLEGPSGDDTSSKVDDRSPPPLPTPVSP